MHWHHTTTQPRTTGGFLSPNTRTTRTTTRRHHHHGGHRHGLGLGGTTAGVTTTKAARSPGTGGLFRRRVRTPRTKVRTTRTTTRRTGGGLFGRSNRRTQRSSVLPVAGTTTRVKPTMGDRISGAYHKIKGSITGHPREEAYGDAKMHGATTRRRIRRTRY
ncbi:hypothetical protein Sste5346_009693 [Sporothrix stenoceras]|uniref:Uncharacterized protein n=1 Tax=Sporothrix stenoceras TaxID=5173 RepID=A0ABR3YIS2_9PEZI